MTNGESTLDSLNLREAMLSVPEQIEASMAAIGSVSGMPSAAKIDQVLILGMGDSGFGGDLAAACARPFAPLPIVVYGGYLPPSWVSSSTLVIAISESGETEETLESLEAAVEAGASLVAVTNGGALAEFANRVGAPVLPVVKAGPMPRGSLGSLATPVMLALEQIGLFPGARVWLEEAAQSLRIRRDQLSSASSPAKELADAIGSTIPVIYGGGAIGTTAARRWKIAFNHNVKTPAFWAPMPDMCHNELSGWTGSVVPTQELFSQIQLRHESEHPQTARRFEFVEEKTVGQMASVMSVEALGDGPAAQLFDLIMVGDLTSLELAANRGVDPGPLQLVDELKVWLDPTLGA